MTALVAISAAGCVLAALSIHRRDHGPLWACLADRCVPAAALRWGTLTWAYPGLHADVARRTGAAIKASGISQQEAMHAMRSPAPLTRGGRP